MPGLQRGAADGAQPANGSRPAAPGPVLVWGGDRHGPPAPHAGLPVHRHHTHGAPLDALAWRTFQVGAEGRGFEAPAAWSETAVGILAEKYALKATPTAPAETSARQVFHRIADTLQAWGVRYGYFAGRGDAEAFRDELLFLLATQRLAFNSPVWFNIGRHAAGHRGGAGQWRVPDEGGEAVQLADAYEHPQLSACFIQGVEDAMFGGRGIYDLMASEARLFKYGSGTGTNFSRIRGKGEPLAGGGTSSGLLGFLKALDASAGVVKSGGTTRRAAKMVVVDADHPEILAFAQWKANEERKARSLLAAGYSGGMEGEACTTVSGQNANNSIRVPDAFLRAVEQDAAWDLVRRTDGAVAQTLPARQLWRAICQAAWECGDPGLQFQDTIQAWNTCKADGEIRATNPCSEHIWLDESACNLASLNLQAYACGDGFDTTAFRHDVRVAVLALDIIVHASSHPTKAIAEGARRHRTVGLGHAGLGGLLMAWGIPYGSDEGRHLGATITSLLSAQAFDASAELAAALGAFPSFAANRACMLDVVVRHFEAACRLAPVDGRGGAAGPRGLIAREAADLWAIAWDHGQAHGFRNAQLTVLAPTGTIGLLMDCATTGIEPAYTLVAYKALAGGGTLRLPVGTVEPALHRLGYAQEEAAAVLAHVQEAGSVAGAPHLKPEHLAVFQAANDPGGNVLAWRAHLEMVAAVQPFLSGGVSKTVNLPATATVEDVEEVYLAAWRLGCKSVALYRDGSKATQVLSATPEQGPPAAAGDEAQARGLLQRFPHLARGWRRPIPYRYAVVEEFSVKVSDPLHPEGVRHFVALKFDPGEQGLQLWEVFWSAGQAGEVLYDISSRLAAEWSRRLRSGEEPLVIASENIGSPGLGGGLVAHELVKRASSGADLVWKLIALEVYGKHDFVPAGDYAAYTARLDRPRFIHEELAQPPASHRERPETPLDGFPEGYRPRGADLAGLRCPNPFCRAGPERILPTGTCHTCGACGESIGAC